MKSILLAGAVSLAVINPTLAERYGSGFVDSAKLYDRCTATPETDDDAGQNVAYCLGYLVGIFDGEEKYLCYPKDLKVGQIREAVVAYLKRNAEERRYLAYGTVVRALNQAFRCNKRGLT